MLLEERDELEVLLDELKLFFEELDLTLLLLELSLLDMLLAELGVLLGEDDWLLADVMGEPVVAWVRMVRTGDFSEALPLKSIA